MNQTQEWDVNHVADAIALDFATQLFRHCKITAKELSERTGLSYPTVREILKGKKNTTFLQIAKISVALELKVTSPRFWNYAIVNNDDSIKGE